MTHVVLEWCKAYSPSEDTRVAHFPTSNVLARDVVVGGADLSGSGHLYALKGVARVGHTQLNGHARSLGTRAHLHEPRARKGDVG